MKFIKVKTRAILPPKDNLYEVLDNYLPKLVDGDVLIITSKVVAIHQGRCVKIGAISKEDLIKQEAEGYIPRNLVPRQLVSLTLKKHTLAAAAGIDESNGNGYYVLWPKNINRFCQEVWRYLKRKYKIKNLAVIMTDSHTIPTRWGVLGVSIGFFGLDPLFDYRGRKDIFGRKLKMTQANVVDSLAALAVLLMGESNEQTPLLIIRGAKFVKFSQKNTYRKFVINPDKDLYKPLLDVFKKQK